MCISANKAFSFAVHGFEIGVGAQVRILNKAVTQLSFPSFMATSHGEGKERAIVHFLIFITAGRRLTHIFICAGGGMG